jgi:hypothetical protein
MAHFSRYWVWDDKTSSSPSRDFKENGLWKLMKNIDGDPKAGSKVMAHFSRYCGLA